MDERMITYRHRDDPEDGIRFRQFARDPLPSWAADVREEIEAEDVSR